MLFIKDNILKLTFYYPLKGVDLKACHERQQWCVVDHNKISTPVSKAHTAPPSSNQGFHTFLFQF
jgi:hypothetical protein